MVDSCGPGEAEVLRNFLHRSPEATYCHDPAWPEILAEAYGKSAFLRVARRDGRIVGAVSVCRMRSRLFGNRLVCLPFLDDGGIVAEDDEIRQALLDDLKTTAGREGLGLEIRGQAALPGLPEPQNRKTGMVLELPAEGEDAYWKSLDAKVRNQVRKAEKSGVTVAWGGQEKLDEFYAVFRVNMRDLGSPVHGRGFFRAVLRGLSESEIGIAYRENRPIGCLFRVHWGETLSIPWASTLKEARAYCPNNALYWQSIRFAFERGCRRVDFGRSSIDEGTYKFKKQWLAEPHPLRWYPFDARGNLEPTVQHAAEPIECRIRR